MLDLFLLCCVWCLLLLLSQITTIHDVKELQSLIRDHYLVSECGITKPFTKITIEDKISIVQSVGLHYVILKTMGELSQFQDGLHCLGVSAMMQSHGNILREFFINVKVTLTAGS